MDTDACSPAFQSEREDKTVQSADLSPLYLLNSSVSTLFLSKHRVDAKASQHNFVLTYHVKLVEGVPLQRVSLPFDMKMAILNKLRDQLDGIYIPTNAIAESSFTSRLLDEFIVGVVNVESYPSARSKKDAIYCTAMTLWYLATTYIAYATLQHEMYHGNVTSLGSSKAYFNNMLDLIWVRTKALQDLAEHTLQVDGYQLLCAMVEVADVVDYHEKIAQSDWPV